MNNIRREIIIRKMNKVTNTWIYYKGLFSGGCCWAAYAIAKRLEQLHIHYDVVCFQSWEGEFINRFEDLNNCDGLNHVAIRVRLNNEYMYIGDVEDVVSALNAFASTNWCTKIYRNISSKDLHALYINNDWNEVWNTNLNGVFLNEIESIGK